MARILVVEDDESMNEILVETLEDEGHEVTAVFQGNHAVHHASKTPFDLVVTDVRLPGMDGVETLSQIREVAPTVKCIVITGYASADTPIRAIRLKVDDYLFKPFSLEYFLNSVERALNQEKEQEAKLGLFQKFANFWEKYRDNALVDLVAERQESFRGLYLGTRSGYLQFPAASEVYARLEVLEDEFRAILNTPKPDGKVSRELQNSYTEVSNRIAALESGGHVASIAAEVPQDQMRALFNAIKGSQLGLDDLQYAPLLRKTPDNRFETLQELLELKHRLWPDLKV